jgi:SAM-dependent methyltransferase
MRVDLLRDIAPALIRDPAGYWVAPEHVATSYPADGNDNCLPVEESSFWFAHRNRAITAAVQHFPPADGPLFDVGAGNGYVSAALQQAGFPAIAIEPNRAGAANAVARNVAHVVCGGLPSAAFREGTAGGIGLFDVVEHVEHDRDFLRALRPYLRNGGRLYITTPAFPSLWSDNDKRAGHFRRYTLRTLRETVSAAGYDVDYATYFFWLLPLPILLFRTLRSKAGVARDTRSSRREHALGGSAVRRIAESCFRFELGRIRRGATIPFGGSCLLIASARA